MTLRDIERWCTTYGIPIRDALPFTPDDSDRAPIVRLYAKATIAINATNATESPLSESQGDTLDLREGVI